MFKAQSRNPTSKQLQVHGKTSTLFSGNRPLTQGGHVLDQLIEEELQPITDLSITKAIAEIQDLPSCFAMNKGTSTIALENPAESALKHQTILATDQSAPNMYKSISMVERHSSLATHINEQLQQQSGVITFPQSPQTDLLVQGKTID